MERIKSYPGKAAMNWLIWGGVAVSAFFWTSLNDPFNAPKSWILSIAAFWLLGWLLFQIKEQSRSTTLRIATIFAGLFLLSMFAAFLATDNKFIGFFGAYQRRTGFLSYLGLTTFFLAAAYLIRLNKLQILERAAIVLALILGIYGFAQHFKIDFIKWNNPYNSVLDTLGNPDFAAACMALFLILNFGIAIQTAKATWVRALAGFNTILLFVVIIFSQVRQGLLVSALGIIIVLAVYLYQKNKYAGLTLSGLTVVAGVLSVLGMLNKGPLVHFFYKISVTFRGDYWRAGWNMFKHHVLFGVGLDRYGANFRQNRDIHQVLRRGPDVVSNAAHNVPLQLASTGGLFVIITYLLLTGFVLWRGVASLRKTTGTEQLLVAVVFSAWVGYEAQSFISIDNLGIAIWGYLLGGAVVGLSVSQQTEQDPARPSSTKTLISVLSGGLAVTALIIYVLFFKAESSLYSMHNLPAPANQQQKVAFEAAMSAPLSYGFKDPQFEFITALRLAQSGDFELAVQRLKNLTTSDPKNYDALNLLAGIYEFQHNWQAAIDLHQQMAKIDPLNSANFLGLGKDYKQVGNTALAKSMIPLINAIDPSSVQAKQALKDLG